MHPQSCDSTCVSTQLAASGVSAVVIMRYEDKTFLLLAPLKNNFPHGVHRAHPLHLPGRCSQQLQRGSACGLPVHGCALSKHKQPRPPKSSYRCGPVWILRCILTVTIIIVISSRTITCTAHIVNNMRQLYAANLLAVVCLDVDVRNYYIASVVWSLWP